MKTTHRIHLTAAALAVCISSSVRAEEPATPVTPHWESSAAAGLTLTRGNSDTLLGTLSLSTGKKWDQNELAMGADGAYGRSKDQKTKENSTTAQAIKGAIQYNR